MQCNGMQDLYAQLTAEDLSLLYIYMSQAQKTGLEMG